MERGFKDLKDDLIFPMEITKHTDLMVWVSHFCKVKKLGINLITLEKNGIETRPIICGVAGNWN